MSGVLYGIGVGPGDPELMTLKAVRIIGECDIIMVPGEKPESTVAYKIASQATGTAFLDKTVGIHMPMTKDKKILNEKHKQAVEQVRSYLNQNLKVGFLTLGDPSIYSTYTYIHKQIKALGYETKMVSGVASFSAVSAKLKEPLVENKQMLHIIPASYQIEEELNLPGTKVLMKTGSKLGQVKELLKNHHQEVMMVERCGMEDEYIYYGVEEIPEQASYYSLLIIKEKEAL